MKMIIASFGIVLALSGCATQQSLEILGNIDKSPINQPSLSKVD